MIFTQEQISEIKRRLAEGGIKDSDLPSADEIKGDELCAIVQEGVNKKMPLWKLFNSPAFETYYQLLQDTITDRMNQLERLIEQVKRENLSVSDEFGDSDTITISQKTLTDALNKIWSKLEEMTGETYQGINMVVKPKYFISEDGCDVHVSANTVDANGIFEYIMFEANGVKFFEAEFVADVGLDPENPVVVPINSDTVIHCQAKIMGVTYDAWETVRKYREFFLFAASVEEVGSSYEHLGEYLVRGNSQEIHRGMRASYPVSVAHDNDNLFIVIGESLQDGFLRADMNGVEIPLTEEPVTIDGNTYRVFKSVNGFIAGSYNIDING